MGVLKQGDSPAFESLASQHGASPFPEDSVFEEKQKEVEGILGTIYSEGGELTEGEALWRLHRLLKV